MSARGGGGKKRQKVRSRSARAGVIFPVGRMDRYLRRQTHKYRIAAGASVYMAAVIEYLTAEVMELSGNAARDNRKSRITPRFIMFAVMNDEEFRELLRDITIPSGGVLPMIHPGLFPRKKQNRGPAVNQPVPVPLKAPTPKATATKKAAVMKMIATIPAKGGKGKSQKVAKGGGGASASSSGGTAAGGFTILSEKKLFLGQKLTVLQGDLVKVTADAIVHPTNDTYYMGGQVGSAIQKAGGKELIDAMKQLQDDEGALNTAEAKMCQGFNFPAKFVIHVNGPTWRSDNCVQNLDKAVKSCLALADEENLKSVAFPSIGSGQAGFPKQTAAQTILRAISNYFVTVMSSSLKQIYFVLYDMESIGVYTSELAKLDS